MFRSVLACFLPALLCVGAGCAHAPPESSLAQLQLRLTEAQRKDAESRKRIDDLENRVFLLTDQLESQKVAAQSTHAPRLPVVMLRPTVVEPASSAAGDEDPARTEEPEFTGAAQSVDALHVRTVLTGSGESGSIANASPAMTSSPEPRRKGHANATPVSYALPSGDSLGVAPVPPITASAPQKHAPMAERAPLDEEPLTAYRSAYADVTAGNYDQAEVKLRAFVKRFPHHDYADNAQYWLGECFYARQRYPEAAAEFRTAVAKYPTGNKAPDALLKLAYSLIASGQSAEGRRMLAEIPTTYPRSEASRLAALRLAELTPAKAKTEALR
ncbi:MAG: tol-pal system protein YbgF [Polyangia bacterium]